MSKASVFNLSSESKRQLLSLGRDKPALRLLKSPWKRIPNVRHVEVETNEYNVLLEEIGVFKRLPPKLTTRRLDPADRMNRYMKSQILRLRQLALVNPVKFWKLAWFLAEKSACFRVAAVKHVLPD